MQSSKINLTIAYSNILCLKLMLPNICNMRDLNKKIKRAFVDYISIQTPEVLTDSGSLRKFAKKIFGGN